MINVLFENMLEGVSIHKLILDDNGTPVDYMILEVNKSFEKILGLKKENVICKLASKIYGEVPLLKEYSDVVINQKSTKFDYYFSSMKRYFTISVTHWEEDKFITIFSDITDLKDTLENYKSLLRAIPDMMARIRYDGLIMDIKPGEGIYSDIGQSVIFIGSNIKDLPFGEVVVKEFQDCVKEVIEKGDPIEYNYTVPIRGEKRHYYSRSVKNGDDEIIVIIRDITEDKRIEEELRIAKDRAEQSDKMKLEYLSNMSHDLRTPMNAIIGFTDLLRTNNLTKNEKSDYINTIINNGKYLMALIDDIIDISKIDAGSLKIENRDFELNKLIEELRLSYLKQIKDKNIEIIIEVDVNKNIILNTDKYRLRQIMANLIGNAIKFTKEGYVKFGYKILNTKQLEIYVEDTGPGIERQNQKIIFEKFKQVGDVGSKTKGAGLGLSICKSLIELLGFKEIKLISELDKGSKFYFTLPYTIKHFNYMTEIKEKKHRKIDFTGKIILIIEDNEDSVTIIKSFLSKTNANIVEMSDGYRMLDYIKNNEVDLILLDIGLPGKNGYKLLEEIRGFDARLPVIVESALAMPDQKSKAYDLGCDDYITKPFNREDFLNKIDNLL